MTLEQKMIRFRVLELHRKYFRAGMYDEARLVLFLLRTGNLHLGLSDASAFVEIGLEDCGLAAWYTHNYNRAHFHLQIPGGRCL